MKKTICCVIIEIKSYFSYFSVFDKILNKRKPIVICLLFLFICIQSVYFLISKGIK